MDGDRQLGLWTPAAESETVPALDAIASNPPGSGSGVAPIARRSDPVTSKVAASEASSKVASWCQVFVENLTRLGHASTANEISGGNESIRKRALDCVRANLVYEHPIRQCMRSGKRCKTYWIHPVEGAK